MLTIAQGLSGALPLPLNTHTHLCCTNIQWRPWNYFQCLFNDVAYLLTREDLRQSVPPRVKHELTDRETEEQRRLLRSEQVENCGPRHLAVRDGLLSVDATPTTVPPGRDATPLVGGESAVQETLRSVCEALPGVGNGDELIGDDGEGERYGNNASGGQCHEATVLAAREVEPADDEATVVTTDYSPEFFALRSPGGSVAVFRQTQSVVASLRRGSDRVTTRTTHTTTTTSTTVQKREWVRGPAQSRCGKQRDYVRLNGIRPHTLVLYTDWSDLTVRRLEGALPLPLSLFPVFVA
uniref:Uncharacterized protein n=1 Tax=Timema monikensis TaxID=170555 RepID=A0A7R9EAH6_9NEOP|nr:unnamed protein product [Timema monikensis]